MYRNIVRVCVLVVVLISLAVSAWSFFGTRSANKLVDEGNVAVDAGNALVTQAGEKYTALFSVENLTDYPGNRERLKNPAQETADLFGQASQQYRLAAAKYDEATQQNVDKVVAEYWSLKVQEYRKFADAKDVYRGIPLLLLDETVADVEELGRRITAITAQAETLDAEVAQLTTQADKLREDHQDDFK